MVINGALWTVFCAIMSISDLANLNGSSTVFWTTVQIMVTIMWIVSTYRSLGFYLGLKQDLAGIRRGLVELGE